MKEIIRTVTEKRYISIDGGTFSRKEDCEYHERGLMAVDKFVKKYGCKLFKVQRDTLLYLPTKEAIRALAKKSDGRYIPDSDWDHDCVYLYVAYCRPNAFSIGDSAMAKIRSANICMDNAKAMMGWADSAKEVQVYEEVSG